MNMRNSSRLCSYLPFPYVYSLPSPLSKYAGAYNVSTTSTAQPRRIAVVGGGITGLATSYYAAKRYPNTQVTLFEATNRLGGVIDSTTVQLPDGTLAVCETGPRTLRAHAPRAMVTIDLIQQLRLEDELIIVLKTDPVASTRYIWYPDHLVSVPVANFSKSIAEVPAPDRLSSSRLCNLLRALWREPLFRGLLPGLLHGIFRRRPRLASEDDSVYNLLQRRFGTKITENLCSGIIHGLYAGDMRGLSARALLPGLWALENKLFGRYGLFIMPAQKGLKLFDEPWSEGESAILQKLRASEAGDLERRRFRHGTIFSFRGGVGTLTDRLATVVHDMDNVIIKTKSHVTSIRDDGRRVSMNFGESHKNIETFSHVISTTSLPVTLNLINPAHSLRTITHVPVMVISLCYATHKLNRPYHGFGYLLPFSLPPEQNPECALGVVFDSDAIPDLDTFRGTKISVMLGGRYWASLSSLPSIDEGIEMAKSLLKRHLGIVEEPLDVAARLEKEAIPQYAVEHFEMLRKVHRLLGRLGGRVRVAGNSYHGIGVHDCLFSARRVGESLDEEGRTGLEWLD